MTTCYERANNVQVQGLGRTANLLLRVQLEIGRQLPVMQSNTNLKSEIALALDWVSAGNCVGRNSTRFFMA